MFYDKNLMNSDSLGDVWKISHNIHAENIDKCNLPKICNELDSWVSSESVLAHRRLSLRASANFIAGAAKLDKLGMDKLYDDVIKLDEDLILRRKRGHNSSSTPESDFSSASPVTPEQMNQQTAAGFDTSFSPIKISRIKPISPIITLRSMSRSSSEKRPTDGTVMSNEDASYDRSSNNNFNLNLETIERASRNSLDRNPGNILEEPLSEENTPENQRKDIGVQTSPILISRHKSSKINSRLDRGFDKQLPFAYILVHDSYASRIPSKIIFTSINSEVNKLI